MERKIKGFTWPKPAAFLLGYCFIVSLVELFALVIRDPDPLLLIFIAPVILAAFHYSRAIYLYLPGVGCLSHNELDPFVRQCAHPGQWKGCWLSQP